MCRILSLAFGFSIWFQFWLWVFKKILSYPMGLATGFGSGLASGFLLCLASKFIVGFSVGYSIGFSIGV